MVSMASSAPPNYAALYSPLKIRLPEKDPCKPRVYAVRSLTGARRGWAAKIDADPDLPPSSPIRVFIIVWPTWSDAIACVCRYYQAIPQTPAESPVTAGGERASGGSAAVPGHRTLTPRLPQHPPRPQTAASSGSSQPVG